MNNRDNNEPVLWMLLLNGVAKKLPLILAVVLLFGLVGGAVSAFLIPPTYRANAELIVNAGEHATQNVTSEQLNTAESLAEIYSIIIKSDTVLEQVISDLKMDLNFEELVSKVSVNSVNGTSVIRVSVEDRSADQALEILRGVIKTAPAVIKDKVEAGSVKIISEPRLTAKPVSPNIPRNTILCALIGLLLMLAIMALRVLRNDTVTDKQQIEERTSLNVLSEIPSVTGKGARAAVMDDQSSFYYKEAYRYLQTNVNLLASSNDQKAIVVTSSVTGEGKTTVSVNLAKALSSAGKSVVLIECDLRLPKISMYLALPQNRNKNGLRGLLSGECVLNDALIEVEGFCVIPSGGTSDSSVELLGSKKMLMLIKLLKERFDYIIMDAPPAGELADAIALCAGADGVLLVARENYTLIRGVQTTADQIRKTGVPILGTVLNCTEPASRKAYGSRYGRYSYYSYSNPKGKGNRKS